jgi:hypothetical protein
MEKTGSAHSLLWVTHLFRMFRQSKVPLTPSPEFLLLLFFAAAVIGKVVRPGIAGSTLDRNLKSSRSLSFLSLFRRSRDSSGGIRISAAAVAAAEEKSHADDTDSISYCSPQLFFPSSRVFLPFFLSAVRGQYSTPQTTSAASPLSTHLARALQEPRRDGAEDVEG